MSIKESLRDGILVYEVFIKGRDSTGKQVGRRRTNIKTLREAKRIEFELQMEIEGFKERVPWKMWVKSFLERFRIEYRNSTYINYKRSLEKWVNPVWNYKYLDEIQPRDVHKLVCEQITGVSSHTRHTILKIIKRIFNSAMENGILIKNPALGIKIRIPQAVQPVLNKSEIQVLLKAAKSVEHRFYPHWALALLTGMRSGELHSLRWTDVDFETGFISITKSWTRFNGEGPTKTAKNRVCPISTACRKFLKELKISSEEKEFVLPRLWEWDQGGQAKVLRDFCKGLGITQVSFHDLRATFITQLLNNGAPLAKVMAIVGHSSIKTTQCYLRTSGKDVVGTLEDFLNVEPPSELETEGKVLKFQS